MLKYVRVAHLVAVSAFAMVATAAAAQTTDTAAADGANEPATGEIIVTANRRAQSASSASAWRVRSSASSEART